MKAVSILVDVAFLAGGVLASGLPVGDDTLPATDSLRPGVVEAILEKSRIVSAHAAASGPHRDGADQKPKQSRRGPSSPKTGGSAMDETLQLTEKPQEAVFLASYGWTGGMGEAVLDPKTWTITFFKDLPIFVDSERVRKLIEAKLPEQWTGLLGVRIAAKIKLVKKTKRNPSIPGAPKETFWEVQILELHDASIQTE
jgi:hypothetical protein